MFKILMRLRFIKDKRVCEVYFDERLSLRENMKMLRKIIDKDNDEFEFYDPYKKIFLDIDIPLKEFNIASFRSYYIY